MRSDAYRKPCGAMGSSLLERQPRPGAAYAAQLWGVRAVVVMRDRTGGEGRGRKAVGGEVVLRRSHLGRIASGRRSHRRAGRARVVPPFDHPDIEQGRRPSGSRSRSSCPRPERCCARGRGGLIAAS